MEIMWSLNEREELGAHVDVPKYPLILVDRATKLSYDHYYVHINILIL